MDLERHDFELDELAERIAKGDHRLVALQVPEGLKIQALEIIDDIESRTDANVILSGDPCFGACDLVHNKMGSMGIDLVAHMGHSQMNIDSGIDTQFIEVTYDGDPELSPVLLLLHQHREMARARLKESSEGQGTAADGEQATTADGAQVAGGNGEATAAADGAGEVSEEEAQEKFLDSVGRMAPLSDAKLGLVGAIQHLHLLPEFKQRLEDAGFDVTIPVGGARLSFPGQVLGCNYSGDDPSIGHYFFLGSGDFHPIGLVLHTGKPLAMLDPYTGDASEMGRERIDRILRQRFGLIMQVDDAKVFGILIGEKPGQMRRSLAMRLKRMLERHGKKGYLIALEYIGPELIDFYPVDAFVNTACPRIAIDDSTRYSKPLITPFELEVALGEKKWEEGYRFDEIP